MVFRTMLAKAAPISRGISTSAVKNMGDTRGVVGSNLPFKIENRYRLFFSVTLYFASGLGLPFLTLRHMILAKNTD